MRKNILTGALAFIAVPVMAWEGNIAVETPQTQIILHAKEGQDLRMAYYGAKVASLSQLQEAGDDLDFPAMPAFGTVDMVQLPALQVQHANGDLNLELQVTDYSWADDGAAIVHTFTLQDKLQPVTVNLFYKA